MFRGAEAWEDDRNSSAYCLGAIESSFRRDKQPLNWVSRSASLRCSPRCNRRTKKKDLGCGALGRF